MYQYRHGHDISRYIVAIKSTVTDAKNVRNKFTVKQWTSSPYWHIKSSTELHRGISALSHGVADLPSRRSLRSVGTNRPVVPTSRLSTVGSRALPVAGPQTWNDLQKTWHQQNHWPQFVAFLLRKSFPDYLLDINWLSPVDLAVVLLLRPTKIIDWVSECAMRIAKAAFTQSPSTVQISYFCK